MKLLKGLILTIAILGIIAGAIYTLDTLGVISIKKTAAQVPVLKNFVKVEDDKKEPSKEELLELELAQAKGKIKELEGEIALLTGQTASSEKELQESKDTIVFLEQEVETLTSKQLEIEDLAKYYGAMKPADAVRILSELEDDLIIGILNNLEKEHAAKILSLMDEKRAAQLTEKMAS